MHPLFNSRVKDSIQMVAKYPNWFEQIAQHNFEEFLLPLAGKEWLRFLQLGCFTGDASVWMAKNVLTGQHSWLDDVDTWEGAANEPVQTEMDFDDVYATYLAKVEGLPVTHRRSTTTDYLLDFDNAVMRPSFFDFIYVDAHHTSASAFLDSELSWPLLKSDGILAIDDYEWNHPDGNPIHAPKLGIHMFLDRHAGDYQLLTINSQVWIKKK
jgi:hypothetical protein